MVEIFKTNVYRKTDAKQIVSILKSLYADLEINFDLKDCDKILRVKGESINTKKIKSIVTDLSFEIEILE